MAAETNDFIAYLLLESERNGERKEHHDEPHSHPGYGHSYGRSRHVFPLAILREVHPFCYEKWGIQLIDTEMIKRFLIHE